MVKTTGKEYFYTVSGLMVPKYKVNDSLTEDIEYFVEWVSKKAKFLETSVERHLDTFGSQMDELYTLLCSINAHWLEMEAARILRLIDINEIELCRKLVTPFVSNLKTLAIDIQMSQSRGFETTYRQRDSIERYRYVINSMKIMTSLLESAEYEKAFDAALGIDELQESKYATPFIKCLASKNEAKAIELTNEIIAVYSKKIEDIIDSATKTIALKKILIVDDMPETLAALSYMLKEHYQIFSFTDGEQVLDFIKEKQQPDAFILDVEMPNMDGFTLAKHIREQFKYQSTPIFFLTSKSTREAILRAAMYGAKAFLVKPANKDIIISKLSSCFE